MDSIPSLASLRYYGGFFFFVLISLACCVAVGGGFSTARAAEQITFSWNPNPQSDNVLGYRLYVGQSSRFDDDGLVKPAPSYQYYIDFSSSQRCLSTDSGPVCETYTDDEVTCEGIYGEEPRCTLYKLRGRNYVAMTAYNAQQESDFTDELNVESVVSPQDLVLLQVIYSLLLK